MQTLGHHLLEEWKLAAQAGQEREKKKKKERKKPEARTAPAPLREGLHPCASLYLSRKKS